MIHLCMNKVDLELEHFMKSAEFNCHKYKRDNIKWSPNAGVWICRRWLLARMKKYLRGETRDPHNLIRKCHLCGMTNSQQITMDELRMEFLYVSKISRFLKRPVRISV
jgi:hypothetical protein